MAQIMNFPSAFPRGTGQEQAARAQAAARMARGSILGDLIQNLGQVATGHIERQKEEETGRLLMGILAPILEQAGAGPTGQQAIEPPATDLPYYARNLPQLEMPAEAMGLDVSPLRASQEAMQALSVAAQEDPSILQHPLGRMILGLGMQERKPTRLEARDLGEKVGFFDPYTGRLVREEDKTRPEARERLISRDLGDEVGFFDAHTGELIRKEQKTRAEKTGNTVRIQGWRDGKKGHVVYDPKDWSEITFLPTGEAPEEDRAPTQWQTDLNRRINHFKEAAQGGVFVYMNMEDRMESGGIRRVPVREEIQIQNEGHLKELMRWQKVDPDTEAGQEILELYRGKGKFLIQEGLLDTEDSQKHTDNQRSWWDKIFGRGSVKPEVKRAEGKESRSAEEVLAESREARKAAEREPAVESRIKEAIAQGVNKEKIAEDLRTYGIDPSIYGL